MLVAKNKRKIEDTIFELCSYMHKPELASHFLKLTTLDKIKIVRTIVQRHNKTYKKLQNIEIDVNKLIKEFNKFCLLITTRS